MKILVRYIEVIIRLIYAFVPFTIVAFIIYLFGYELMGNFLPGSDNANFVTLADWLYRWFPEIPFWFPNEGGGVSFTTSYPIFSHLITVLIAKLSGIGILHAFRLFALISTGLISISLYLLALKITKNQTAAAIAAITYPLSPIAWVFVIEWGFFAEHVSHIFFILSLMAFDIYYFKFIEAKPPGRPVMASLFLYSLVSAIMLLTHPTPLFALVALQAFFMLVYPLVANHENRPALLRSITAVFIGIVSVVLLSLFWLLPYFRYQGSVSDGSTSAKVVYSNEVRTNFLQNAIYPQNFFGWSNDYALYESPDQIIRKSVHAWRNIAFPFAVSLLASVGLLGSLFLNRKLFAYGISSLLVLVFALFPNFAFEVSKLPVLYYFSSWRAMIVPARFLTPILAGYGAYTLAYLLFFPLRLMFKKITSGRRVLVYVFTNTGKISYALSALVIAALTFYCFRNWPDSERKYILSYGPETSIEGRKLDLRDIWLVNQKYNYCLSRGFAKDEDLPKFCHNSYLLENFIEGKLDMACNELTAKEAIVSAEVHDLCYGKQDRNALDRVIEKCDLSNLSEDLKLICQARPPSLTSQLKFSNWPKPDPSSSNNLISNGFEIFDHIPNETNTRLDIGTSLGGFMMVTPYYTEMPALPVYFNQSSLMSVMWNYQLGTFYAKDSVWPQPIIVDELTKYFGIEYVMHSKNITPMEKFPEDKWDEIIELGVNENQALMKYSNPTSLITVSDRPVILVIGQKKYDAYFRIFHLANLGSIGYDDAIIVNGGDCISSYGLEELKNFDLIILDGYSYEGISITDTWQELDNYVKDGGSLFINTGWQYVSADWQLDQTPEFFPLKAHKWENASASFSAPLLDNNFQGVDIDSFAPLKSGNNPWGVSTSDSSDLRSWAMPILKSGFQILVAGGQYGQGRVIWTGLDLPGHIGAYSDNQEEISFYTNLINYLLPPKGSSDYNVSWIRNHPDEVTFKLSENTPKGTFIYWREAYHQDFKANQASEEGSRSIKTYKAGPGMTLMFISGSGDITLRHEDQPIVIIARLVSFAFVLALLLFLLFPNILNNPVKRIIYIFKRMHIVNLSNEDTDY